MKKNSSVQQTTNNTDSPSPIKQPVMRTPAKRFASVQKSTPNASSSNMNGTPSTALPHSQLNSSDKKNRQFLNSLQKDKQNMRVSQQSFSIVSENEKQINIANKNSVNGKNQANALPQINNSKTKNINNQQTSNMRSKSTAARLNNNGNGSNRNSNIQDVPDANNADRQTNLKNTAIQETVESQNDNESDQSEQPSVSQQQEGQRLSVIDPAQQQQQGRRKAQGSLLSMQSKNIQNFVKNVKKAFDWRESRQAINYLLNVVKLSIQSNAIILLGHTMMLIGEFYLLDGDLRNAVFAFCHLKTLCDKFHLKHLKFKALFAIAQCCGNMNQQEDCIRLLKKALQYAWHIESQECECLIYEQLGKVYYQQGDLLRAKYYHKRSLEFKFEDKQSRSRVLSELDIVKNHGFNIAPFVKLNRGIIAQLGIQYQEETEGPPKPKYEQEQSPTEDDAEKIVKGQQVINFSNSNVNQIYNTIDLSKTDLKFETVMPETIQIEELFLQGDMKHEVMSPRQPLDWRRKPDQPLARDFIEEQTDFWANFKVQGMPRRSMSLKRKIIHIPPREITKNISLMDKKVSLEAKIQFRLNEMRKEIKIQKQREEIDAKIKFTTNGSQSYEGINPPMVLSHKSRNRNIEAFGFANTVNTKKLQSYFEVLKHCVDSGGGQQQLGHRHQTNDNTNIAMNKAQL